MIQIDGDRLTNLYGMTVTCHADPAVYRGLQVMPDALFPPSVSIKMDSGFQPTGQWDFGGLLKNPAEPITGSGTAFLVNWEVLAAFSSPIRCDVVLTSRSGELLPVENATLSIDLNENMPSVTAVASSTVVSPSPTVEDTPTFTPTPLPSVSPTLTATPTTYVDTGEPVAATREDTVVVQGVIESAAGLHEVEVTVAGAESQRQFRLTEADGFQFNLELKPGPYTLIVSSAHHLSLTLHIDVTGAPIVLPLLSLRNGDVNEDGTIDLVDGTLISASYGLPQFMPNADLNHDGAVDIFDMAIFSGNFGETVW